MSQQAGKPKKRSITMILLLFLLIGIFAGAIYYFMGPFGSDEKPKTAKKIAHKIVSKSMPVSKKIGASTSAEPVGGSTTKTTPAKVGSATADPAAKPVTAKPVTAKAVTAKAVTAKAKTEKTGAVAKPVKLVNFEGDSAEALKQKIAELENKISESEKECASAEKDHKKTIDSLMAQIDKLKKSGRSEKGSPVVSARPKSGSAVSTRAKKEKRVIPKKASGQPVFPVGATSYKGVPIETYRPRKTFQPAPVSSYAPRTASSPETPVSSYAPQRKIENDFKGTVSYFGGDRSSRKASGKTLFDMSMRFGESYGGGSENRYKLAPGVAVYPRKFGAN